MIPLEDIHPPSYTESRQDYAIKPIYNGNSESPGFIVLYDSPIQDSKIRTLERQQEEMEQELRHLKKKLETDMISRDEEIFGLRSRLSHLENLSGQPSGLQVMSALPWDNQSPSRQPYQQPGESYPIPLLLMFVHSSFFRYVRIWCSWSTG